jgi:hypothetical protein
MSVSSYPVPGRLAVVVWLDHWHAFVARRSHGPNAIVEVARDAEPEEAYLRRVAQVACDCPRVMILGPDDDRLAFDREYESIYERPDRFVEVEACPWPSSSGLLDRLRLLEGADAPVSEAAPEIDEASLPLWP